MGKQSLLPNHNTKLYTKPTPKTTKTQKPKPERRKLFPKWRRLSKTPPRFSAPTRTPSTKFRPRRLTPSQRPITRRKTTMMATAIITTATLTTTAGGGAKGVGPPLARKAARRVQSGRSIAPDQRANAASPAASLAARLAASLEASLAQSLVVMRERRSAAARRNALGAQAASRRKAGAVNVRALRRQ